MSVREVLTIGDPRLRQVSEMVPQADVTDVAVQTLIDDLVETMRDANGAGIAAPQVGALWRICVVEVKDNPRYPYKPNIPLSVLINPRIRVTSEATFSNYEGCLSVPNLRGLVKRHRDIEVSALDRQGNSLTFTASGLAAGTYQHEFDHLDGVLFVDRVEDPTTLATWDNYHEHHKEPFIESLKAAGLIEEVG